MPTVLKTFTPLTGGASLVIPETPSAHSKPGSIWNRLKRSLQTVQLSAKKFGEHEGRIRGEDGAFYKIGMANEYIQKLEAELSAKSSGSDSTAVAQLTSENQTLKTKIAELEKKQPASAATFSTANRTDANSSGWSPRNAQPGDPCDPKLLGLYEAVYGENRRKQMEHLAVQNKLAVETMVKRHLNLDGLKVVGLDLSDIAAQYGAAKEVTGLLRLERSNLQRKVDEYIVQLNTPKPTVELQAKTPKRAPDLINLSRAVLGEAYVNSLKTPAASSGKSYEDVLKIQLAAKAIKVPGVDLSAAEAYLGADWPQKIQRWDRETAQQKADKFVAETCF